MNTNYKNELRLFYEVLCNKLDKCVKEHWSPHVSAGFTKDDISNLQFEESGTGETRKFTLDYSGHRQSFKLSDLNIRELNELKKWIEQLPSGCPPFFGSGAVSLA